MLFVVAVDVVAAVVGKNDDAHSLSKCNPSMQKNCFAVDDCTLIK